MKCRILPFLVLVGLGVSTHAANAQETLVKEHKTTLIATPRAAVVTLSDIKEDYFPVLQVIEKPKPGIVTEEDDLEQKAAKARVKPDPNPSKPQYKNGGILAPPVRLRNFEGNSYDGAVPDDNDVAVSNDGKILAVMNTTLNTYDSTGKLIKSVSCDAFSNPIGLKNGKTDPRVLYDPEADRFIICYLNGFDDKTSQIVFGFSQTNDPSGAWNVYSVSGNPLKDTTWSDYPILALTKGELFLTINSLQDNKTWQLGFRQDLIWQINKDSGYNGQNLVTKVHSGIKYNGAYVRNSCPVQGGSGLTGPECYFLSDKNFSNKTDSVFLLKISGSLSDPNATLTVNLLHATSGTYGIAPDAHQPSTAKVKRTLQTNDARILDAFIENNTIQYVSNSVTPAGKAGVQHGIITNASTSSPSAIINILGDTLEFGYPSIAYAGIHAGDDDAFIMLDHTGDTTFPGHSVVFYKGGNYSNAKRLYNGKTYAQISGTNERWGDYSGAQRKYNEPGKAWTNLYYGRTVGSGLTALPGNAARVSEIQSPFLPKPAGIDNTENATTDVSIYPVPSSNYAPIQVTFTAEEDEYYNFNIYNSEGKLVTTLLREKAVPGKNRFSFSTSPLGKGIYFLKISSDREVLSKKFVVE